MPSFIITADSGCDLSLDACKAKNIVPVCMKYTVDGEEFLDSMDHSKIKGFYDTMREGKMPKTVQLNMYDFISFWEPLLKEGKDIIHICMSSGISGTYQSALNAVAELKKSYSDRKIEVVDTRMTSAGSGLIAIECARLRDEGKNFEECLENAQHNSRCVHACFTTDDITYLHRGGRVSKTGMILSKALHIFPVMHVDGAGELKVFSKCRGTAAAWETVAKHIEENCIDPQNQTLYVCDADNPADIKKFAEAMQKRFGFKDVYYSKIGAIIGAHTGPGLLTLFFLGKERWA